MRLPQITSRYVTGFVNGRQLLPNQGVDGDRLKRLSPAPPRTAGRGEDAQPIEGNVKLGRHAALLSALRLVTIM